MTTQEDAAQTGVDATAATGGERRWWESTFRTFQTNLREIDAGMDVDAALDTIEEHGADTWLLSVGGIIANHPSRLDSQTVNPRLETRVSRDLVGDATRAARDRGIRVLARMDFSKIDAIRAERHPEWCFVSPMGEPQIYNGYRSVCPSGAYYQREMFAVVAEVLEKYPISGFFFNWMSFNEVDYSRRYWGVCHCEACRRGFSRFAPGTPLPAGPEDQGYARWRQYCDGVLADLNHRVRAHVRELSPDAALIQGDRADITFHEANNAVGRTLWHRATADAVDVARSADPSRTVFVNSVAFVDMPYRWAGEDLRHMEQYAVQTIAHGGQPSTYIMGTPADSPFPGLAGAARITRFHRDHRADYVGLAPTARTALVRPVGTGRSRAEFEGWHTALSEGHIPFAVLLPTALSGVCRDRFDLVILPDLGELSEDAVRALSSFVDRGGAVVSTGSSAWSAGSHQLEGGAGRLTQHAVFESEESLRSLHVDLGGAPTGRTAGEETGGGDQPIHVPVTGEFRALGVAADRGPRASWPALGRALYGPPEKCYGNEETGHPGQVSWRQGDGAVTVLPWLPGQVLRNLGLAVVGAALVELVSTTGGGHLRWRTTLPSHIQLVVGRGARGPLIHLLNRSGERPQRFVDPVPAPARELEIPCEARPRAVEALVAGESLDWSWSQGSLTLKTPQVDVFEAIAIRL